MSVKKSFSIFVIIVVLSIVGVLFCSIDASTFAMLGDANPSLLACAAALVVLMWFLDAFKFMTLARAAGEKLSLRCTLSVVWINYFGSAITPMQSGGGLTIFHGTKDTLICGCYGENPWLLSGRVPNAPKVCRRVPNGMRGGHEMDWVRACKESKENRVPCKSDFSEAGPMNEMVVTACRASPTSRKQGL